MARNLVVHVSENKKNCVVGYMNYWLFAGEVHLNNIAVRKDYREKGIASMMLREMIKRSWNEGARWGTLEVRMKNLAAVRLYERYGYVVKGKRPNYYHDSNEDALIMWCNLEDAMKRISHHDA
jgi:ribosomal-protein-alanine N-acetyltransferase